MSEDSSPDTSAEEFEALRPGFRRRVPDDRQRGEPRTCARKRGCGERGRPPDVTTPEAYLVRMVTNLAIDRLRSAQHRREQYVVVPPRAARQRRPQRSGGGGRALRLLTLAFLVMLDELTPIERAAAAPRRVRLRVRRGRGAVGRSPDVCRHWRAAAQEARPRARRTPAPDSSTSSVGRAAPRERRERRHRRLMQLLAPDVVQLGDGGPDRHRPRSVSD